jgi:shikimate kinase
VLHPPSHIIYLVGMPGSGKTTFGKKLAKLLDYHFLDLDSIIEEINAATIESIFTSGGEGVFRKNEQIALYQTKQLQHTVIATGGGCAAYEKNMEWMLKRGLTVYLNAPISLICDRLTGAKTERPLLKGIKKEGIRDFITQKLAEREPKYLLSDLVIQVPIKSAETLVKQSIKPYLGDVV